MLEIRLAAGMELRSGGAEVALPASRRARAVLAYLALNPGPQPRSRLASRFWPDVLDESARTSLRSALSALRRALGPAGERYLIASRDEVGLADETLVWTDLAEFERCADEDRLDAALEQQRLRIVRQPRSPAASSEPAPRSRRPPRAA